jgi:hypothetical protein
VHLFWVCSSLWRRLKHVQTDLEATAKKSGAQVNRLLEICDETAEVHVGLRKHLQAEVLQQIMTAVLSTDRNHDFRLDADELDSLMMRLKFMPSVEFHEDNFRAQVAKEPYGGSLTITDICAITRTLNKDIVDESKAIFTFKQKKKTAA